MAETYFKFSTVSRSGFFTKALVRFYEERGDQKYMVDEKVFDFPGTLTDDELRKLIIRPKSRGLFNEK